MSALRFSPQKPKVQLLMGEKFKNKKSVSCFWEAHLLFQDLLSLHRLLLRCLRAVTAKQAWMASNINGVILCSSPDISVSISCCDKEKIMNMICYLACHFFELSTFSKNFPCNFFYPKWHKGCKHGLNMFP